MKIIEKDNRPIYTWHYGVLVLVEDLINPNA